MSDINRDLDRYLKRRRGPVAYSNEPSFMDKLFAPKPEAPSEDLSDFERKELESMEADIKTGSKRLEQVQEMEHELEEEQEEKVSLYHQVMRFFKRKHDPSEPEVISMPAPSGDEDVREDFRELARIQVTWLERLPTRIKQEFIDSDDYAQLKEILQRRGAAKR